MHHNHPATIPFLRMDQILMHDGFKIAFDAFSDMFCAPRGAHIEINATRFQEVAIEEVQDDVRLKAPLPPFNLSTPPGACVFWQSPRETAGWCAGLP